MEKHTVALKLIGDGNDIWIPNAPITFSILRELYKTRYTALPTNTQTTERGVNESGYVSLRRRSKNNRSDLASTRARTYLMQR